MARVALSTLAGVDEDAASTPPAVPDRMVILDPGLESAITAQFSPNGAGRA